MTTIYSQGMASYIRSTPGTEPYRRFSDFLWSGSAAHGNTRQYLVISSTPLARHGSHRRICGARANCIYSDPVRGILKRCGTRHSNDGMLAGNIGNSSWDADQPRAGCRIYDGTAARRLHHSQLVLHAPHDASRVDVHQQIKFLDIPFILPRRKHNSGVVERIVQLAMRADNFIDQVGDILFGTHVKLGWNQLPRRRLSVNFIKDICCIDNSSPVRKGVGSSKPDPRAAPVHKTILPAIFSFVVMHASHKRRTMPQNASVHQIKCPDTIFALGVNIGRRVGGGHPYGLYDR